VVAARAARRRRLRTHARRRPPGRQRPLAVAALEDKIVQRATAALLNAIYEEDFLGFSYGFRTGRGAHDALDALCVGIHSKKVSFILDADIRSFFDEISQDWLIRFLEHRIGDRRIIRLVQKWLKAGILEDGVVSVSDRGTGQGSVISPLLANIYLHYALDLWAVRWRQRQATGDMIIVRYADDFIVGFEHQVDARFFLDEMRERLGKFALSLHPEKTRLIEFGRFAAERRKRRGLGKPETFNFLGFTFICGKTRAGKFQIRRKTRADDPKAPPQVQELEPTARVLEVKVVSADANRPEDLDNALQALASARVDVVIVLQTSMLISENARIAESALAKRLATVYGYREHVDAGGLISYGVDLRWCFQRGAHFIDKILHGAAPGDLPVEFPTKVVLSVNLKTAKALGLTVPPSLLARAEEVIE